MADFFDNIDTKTKICCGSISGGIILSTILVLLSFGAVEPTEYGILYNSLTKELDNTTIFEGGLQYTGLFNKLITFPSIH